MCNKNISPEKETQVTFGLTTKTVQRMKRKADTLLLFKPIAAKRIKISEKQIDQTF